MARARLVSLLRLTAPLQNDAIGLSGDSFLSKGIAKMALGFGEKERGTRRCHR